MAPSSAHPSKKPRTAKQDLLTHARLLALADDSPSIIRVRNLQVTLKGPKDAWGRDGKPQPALVNVEVRMREPFGESSETDEVKGDTVHYGLLSKAVLELLGEVEESKEELSLAGHVDRIWSRLTGYSDISCNMRWLDSKGPFLKTDSIAYLRVSITMTKASLLGEAVTVSSAAVFYQQKDRSAAEVGASSLTIEGLRVPTLVGVNANERTARQIVLANLVVEQKTDPVDDLHPELEACVVKEMSESSFETLESLAQAIMERLKVKHGELVDGRKVFSDWLFGIELRKPVAVPLAEAACVELREKTQKLRVGE